MPRHRSASPPRQSREETTPPSGSGGGNGGAERGLVIHRVTKEVSTSGAFPTLTKTNYFDWAALMRVMLQARGLWNAVSVGTADYVEDRMALEVIAKAVPAELMGTIASKATAKIAWDAISTMHVGVERVRKAKANTLRREFDGLKFRDGETVDEFGVRINRIAHQLAVLNDACAEEEIVRKFLQALPPRYAQIAMAIETLLDLSEISVEELIGRLKSAEERHGLGGGSIASLNLTEDELIARVAAKMQLSGDVDDRKSTTGIIFFLGEMPISWQSQKQKVVALSSCEAEYIAGAAAACQAVWLSRLLGDVIGIKLKPPQLKMDNMSAIALSKNSVLHDRSKHIDTKFHFIRECLDSGKICLDFTSSQEQLADILTKSLGRAKFCELREKIGVVKVK